MSPSRDKPIAGVASIIALLSSIYAFTEISSIAQTCSSSQSSLITAVIFSFNIAILLAWFAFGLFGGIIISIIAFLAVLFLDLKMNIPAYSGFSLPFFLTIFLAHSLLKERNKINQSYILKSEKLDEEINLLLNSVEEKRSGISSFEEKMKRYSALKGVVESLSTVLSLDEINKLIISDTLKILDKKSRALLFLVNAEKQELILSASQDTVKVKAKKGDAFDRWVLRHRRSLIIEDITSDFRFPVSDVDESKAFFRSLIAVPLVSENKVIGILRMDSMKEVYSQDDLRVLDIIAALGSVAIENAFLYSRIQALAIRDSLTGLVVRRHFFERFKEEIRRAARKKGALSLLILDIDHFKEYNDKFGHTSGDLVLKHLASTVSAAVEEGDIVGRYGGEEIVALLYGKTKKSALAAAERMRKTIKEKPLVLRRNEAKITVSIGISSYPEDAVLEEDLVRIADERLYKAKMGGRDRSCSV